MSGGISMAKVESELKLELPEKISQSDHYSNSNIGKAVREWLAFDINGEEVVFGDGKFKHIGNLKDLADFSMGKVCVCSVDPGKFARLLKCLGDKGLENLVSERKLKDGNVSITMQDSDAKEFILRKGNCLPAGTKVNTGFGKSKLSCIEDIKIGDTVLTYDEDRRIKKLAKVTNTFHRIAKDFSILKFSNGNEIACTLEHPVFVTRRNGNIFRKWIPARNLEIGDKCVQLLYPGLAGRLRFFNNRGKTHAEMGITSEIEGRTAEKISSTVKGMWSDPGSVYNSRKHRDSIGVGVSNKFRNNKKYREATLRNLRRIHADPDIRKRRSQLSKRLWGNKDWKNYVLSRQKAGAGKRPNNLESNLIAFLDSNFPGEWKYIGDGRSREQWFDGVNPDFVSSVGDKVIEVFSPYWKEKDYGSVDAYKKIRRRALRKANKEVLFIEDCELLNGIELLNKIDTFAYNPKVEIVEVVGNKTECNNGEDVYDIEVADGHCFFAEGILVHNSWGWIKNLPEIFDIDCPIEEIDYKYEAIIYGFRNAGIEFSMLSSPARLSQAYMQSEIHGVFPRFEDIERIHWSRAYSAAKGGRMEAGKLGTFDNIFDYDLCSAYGSLLLELPCITRQAMAWEDIRGSKCMDAIADCTLAFCKCQVVMPNGLNDGFIPFRADEDSTYFPQDGAIKIMLAKPEIDICIASGIDIEIIEGSFGFQAYDIKPFRDLVMKLWKLTKNDMLRDTAKRMLSMSWGKFWSMHDGKASPLWNPVYAAHVPSMARARLWTISQMVSGSVISFAVDGISSKKAIPKSFLSDDIGGLRLVYKGKMTSYTDFFRDCGQKKSWEVTPNGIAVSTGPIGINAIGTRSFDDIGSVDESVRHIPFGSTKRMCSKRLTLRDMKEEHTLSPPRVSEIQDLYEKGILESLGVA
jgi:hypothetical protein